MRYALIDNSTLTSIQRLLGEIQVKNTAIVDNDILSLENYLQAILFFDTIICIDDYKDEYRDKRLSFFPDIKVIPKSYFAYDTFVEEANKITRDIVLEVRSGKISDKDFKDYFDRLKMNFIFTWDMSSSNFFLTQKMLVGNHKIDPELFSKLHSLIFRENNEVYEVDGEIETRIPTLIGSDGTLLMGRTMLGDVNNIPTDDGLSPQFKAMISSLNWLSQRTAFYVLSADYLNADLFIQPIRQEFLENVIKRIFPNISLGKFSPLLNKINNEAQEALEKILEISNTFCFSQSIPLFTAFFAHRTNDPRRIIEEAYSLRNELEFFEARTKLRELSKLLDEEKRNRYIRDINLLNGDLNKLFEKIKSKYGIGDRQGIALSNLSFIWTYIPILKEIKIPDWADFRIKELEFLKHVLPVKGFRAVYRNLLEDLITIERLGKYRDILTSRIIYHEHASFQSIKTEDIAYKNASSYWKRPM